MLRVLAWSALLVAGACAQSSPNEIIAKRDFSHAGDFGSEDLGVDDLGDTDGSFDLAGDMVRTTWTDHSTGTQRLWNVWSNGAGLIFVVGDGTTLLRSTDGITFSADTTMKPGSSDFAALSSTGSGPPAKPLYIGGTGGAVWSYSGNLATSGGAWTAENLGTASSINGVWVAPDGTAFAVGAGNTAKKRDPMTGMWTDMGNITKNCYNLWGYKTATGYVLYAVGYDSTVGSEKGMIWKSVDGGAFVAQTSGTNKALYGIWGSSDTDLYAVGDLGTILHSNGGGVWTAQTSPVSVALEAVSGASASEVYIVGDNGTVLHKYGLFSTTWEKEVLANPAENRNILGVWASPTEVWVVGKPDSANGKSALILKK